MANEFIIRKGFKSLQDSELTGSLNLSGNIVADGTVQAEFASNTSTAISGAFDSVSSSLASELLKNTTDTLTGDLTVTGTLTAQDLHVQEVTSSIVYSSGSNVFGENISDTQEFTGSLLVSGSSNSILGKVGINAPSALQQLYVNGDSGTSVVAKFVNTNYGYASIDITNSAGSVGLASIGNNLSINENVGIGTNSVASTLHVKTSTDSTVNQGLVIERSANTDRGYINYQGGGFQFRATDGDPLVFGQVSDQRMRIGSDGNVGIGTTSANAPLAVVGTGAGSIGTINIKGSNPHLGFTSGSGTFRSWVGHFDTLGHGSEADLNIKTGYGTTGNIRFTADGDTTAAQMYLQGSSGHLGIGTTDPGSRRLSVHKNTAITAGFNDISEFLDTTLGVGGSVSLNVGRENATRNLGKMAFKYAGDNSTSNALNFGFYDADNLMTILANGSVGIGTTSPSGDLEISGSGNSNRTITFNPSFNDDISISSMGTDASGWNAVTLGQANSQNNSAAIRFKYTGAGSTNNYLGLGFYANDDKLVIRANGNVGIGTADPNHALDIYSNTNVPLRIHRPSNANLDSSGAWGIGFSTRGDTNKSTTDTRAGIFSAYNGDLFFAVDAGGRVDDDPDGNIAMWIEGANRYVGIGTTSPQSRLDVRPNDGGSDPRYIRTHFPAAGDYNSASTNTEERVPAGLRFGWYANYWQIGGARSGDSNIDGFVISDTGDERLVISNAGHVGIANTNPLFELCIGAADAPNRNMLEIAVNSSDTGTNIIQNYNRATAAYTPLNIASSIMTFGVGSNATERMRITSAGNVGIGTTNPISKLDVEGVLTIGGSSNSATAGSVAIQDDYSGNNHLANIGWTRSSGGPYLAYGVKQDGSADWKSTIDIFSSKRSFAKLDEDSFVLAYATSSQEAVDNVIAMTSKFNFNLEAGSLNINRSTASGTGRLVIEGGAYEVTGSGQAREGLDIKTDVNPGSGNYGAAISLGANGSGRAAISSFQGTSDSDNQGLAFFTHGSTGAADADLRMIIASNGEVGIGTTDPRAALEVDNNSDTGGDALIVTTGANNGAEYTGIRWDIADGSLTYGAIRTYLEASGYGRLAFMAGDNAGNSLSEYMCIASEGKVGIGTTSPAEKLEVNGAIRVNNYVSADSNFISYNQRAYYDTAWKKTSSGRARQLQMGEDNGGTLEYRISNVAGGSAGDAISWTSLIKVLDSGGITFNGDTAAANALDDYEEGTWTPVLTASSSAPSVGYAYRSGDYTKIGNIVFCRFGFKVNSISGGSGTVRISGLPYTHSSQGAYQEPNISVQAGGLSTADYAYRTRMFVANSNTYIEGRIVNNSDTAWNISEITSTSWIIAEFFYHVN